MQLDSESYLEIKPESETKTKYHPARMYFWQRVIWDDFDTSDSAPSPPVAAPAVPTASTYYQPASPRFIGGK